MCPTLGTTTSAINGLGMGVATLFVLTCSNVAISLIKNLIPDKVRIPAFIVVIASFVTVVQLCMEAYVPDLYATLGVFIPLIVVNCIILGRAEAFASKNNVADSALDGIGIGLGFTLSAGSRPRSARQRLGVRPEIHPGRRNTAVHPRPGSLHGTGLPDGHFQKANG